MIITDIEQIDLLAEKLLNDNSEYLSIDPTDREYAFIKEHSDSLKAIRMDGELVSEELAAAFRDELMQAGTQGMQTILLHVETDDNILFEQLEQLLNTIHNGLEQVNLIWETAFDRPEKGVTLFAIIGYRKTE